MVRASYLENEGVARTVCAPCSFFIQMIYLTPLFSFVVAREVLCCCPSWTHQEITATVLSPSGNRKRCPVPFCEGPFWG